MKSEFEVKEKVLCYEPDENKARVLYDATIVEIAEKSSGREYVRLLFFLNKADIDCNFNVKWIMRVHESSREWPSSIYGSLS